MYQFLFDINTMLGMG